MRARMWGSSQSTSDRVAVPAKARCVQARIAVWMSKEHSVSDRVAVPAKARCVQASRTVWVSPAAHP